MTGELVRSRELAHILAILSIGMCVVLFVAGLLPMSPGAHVVAFVACAAVGAEYVFRVRKLGVRLYRDRVVVVNPLSTRVIPIEDVQEFRVGRKGMSPRSGIVSLKDGTEVKISAIQARNPLLFPDDRGAQGPVDQLNEQLAIIHPSGQ